MIRPLSLFCILALMVSCSDDDPAANPLAGTWILKGFTTQNCVDTSQNVSTPFTCSNSYCNKYTFTPDGILEVQQISGSDVSIVKGSYKIVNTTVSTKITGPTALAGQRSFEFIVSGSTLYLKENVVFGTGKCSGTTVLGM